MKLPYKYRQVLAVIYSVLIAVPAGVVHLLLIPATLFYIVVVFFILLVVITIEAAGNYEGHFSDIICDKLLKYDFHYVSKKVWKFFFYPRMLLLKRENDEN